MNKNFVFEVDTDDVSLAPAESPWEFSRYSETVSEEHLKRKTTSVDYKISQARLKYRQSGGRVICGEEEEEEEEEDRRRVRSGKGSRKDRRGRGGHGGKKGGDIHWEEEAAAAAAETSDDYSEEDSEIPEGAEWKDEFLEDAHRPEDVQAPDKRSSQEDTETEDEEDITEGNEDSVNRQGEDNDVRLHAKANKNSVEQPGFLDKGVKLQYDHKGVKISPTNYFDSAAAASFNAKTFLELNISRPLIRACESLGYQRPTPIQGACIPLSLTGRDICGSAVTGSGKTAAFALPLLERLLFRPRRIPAIRVLVLTPTRELAVQVHSMIEKLAQFTDIRCCLVVGGLSNKVQEVALRSQPDIVVATPGRMIDHLHNTQSVGLEELAILVLDEADRLLELGFSEEVHELVRLCPKRRQTLLFSATMTEEVDDLIKLSLTNPVRISADPSTKRPSTLSEEVIRIRPQHEANKEAVLLALCSRSFKSKTIIFSGTKVEAHRLKILFGLSGLKAVELHGNLTQAQRLDALELFRKREADFLVATDVAARGLDIVGVETVINFECPRDITVYVHRVGRTARAGKHGCAVTFVTEKDRSLLKSVAKKCGSSLKSRVIATTAIAKWINNIEEMEDTVRAIFEEEKEERALRKAEMEANKAQNMLEHEDEIFSRPKRIWFQTPKEKRQAVKAAQLATSANKNGDSKVVSIQDAEEMKLKEKRLRAREKNMTRRKRRRLEASREVAEEQNEEDGVPAKVDGHVLRERRGKASFENGKRSLAGLGYQRAKSVKAATRAQESTHMPHNRKPTRKSRFKPVKEKKRRDEMHEMFQGDISEVKRQKQRHQKGFRQSAMRKPGISRKAFKSKARYKRR